MKPIIQNEKDEAVYRWLVEQVGVVAIENACCSLMGNRKPYLSNVVKYLNLTVPKEALLTRPDDAKQKLAELRQILAAKR
ncbi:MAG: cryptic plasmid protein A [Neisseria animaloris]|nr:cryptic plasmid protein A [Neisseria animaloris]